MIGKLLFHIISGILGLFLAIKFVPNVGFSDSFDLKTLLITGSILGLVNFFIKPVLKAIFLPLRILTFGLFSLIINMFLVWVVVDILSPIEIQGFIALFWTTIIIWALNFFFGLYTPAPRKRKIVQIEK